MMVGELILELNRRLANKEIKPTDNVYIPDTPEYYCDLKVVAVNPHDQNLQGVYLDTIYESQMN